MSKINVIKTEFSIDERGTFIKRVVDSCFWGTEFHIELLEPVFQITLMQMMTDKAPITTKTNIDGKEIEIIDYNATYKMIQDENIMSQIKDGFGCGIFSNTCSYIDDLYSDVIESLEYKKAQMISMSSPLSDLLTTIKNVVENMDMSKATDIIEMASKMNNAGFNDSGKIIDMIVEKNKKKDVK